MRTDVDYYSDPSYILCIDSTGDYGFCWNPYSSEWKMRVRVVAYETSSGYELWRLVNQVSIG